MRMPVKLLENLTNEFWEMRSKFKKDAIKAETDKSSGGWIWFDYPDYYGLSYKVYSRLTSDFVDSLQGELFYELEGYGLKKYKEFFKSKRDLRRHLVRIWKIYGLSE